MAKRFIPNVTCQGERTTGPDLVPVYHVHLSTMGNGPTFDNPSDLWQHVREVLDEEDVMTVTIRKEQWPVKKFVDLPEFQGY